MRYTQLLLTLTFLCFSLLGVAKVNVGVEVMPQFSDRFSWGAGVNVEIPLWDRFYISPGVGYSCRHRCSQSRFEITEYRPEGDVIASYEKASLDIKGHYLSIPLLIGYKGYVGATYTIKFGAGVYYAYGLGGRSKLKLDDNGNVSWMLLPTYKTSIAKKSDFGLCVVAQCLLYEHYQIGLNLQHGLRKIYEGVDVQGINDPFLFHRLGPGALWHQSVGLSIGYLF